MTTDIDRIAADGIPLTLTDGREVRIKLDFRAARQISKEFGSLLLAEQLQDTAGLFDVVLGWLYHSVQHFHAAQFSDRADLEALLDVGKVQDYWHALDEMLSEAFPAPSSEEGKATGEEASTSPGPNGSRSRSSDSGVVSMTSGV